MSKEELTDALIKSLIDLERLKTLHGERWCSKIHYLLQ